MIKFLGLKRLETKDLLETISHKLIKIIKIEKRIDRLLNDMKNIIILFKLQCYKNIIRIMYLNEVTIYEKL